LAGDTTRDRLIKGSGCPRVRRLTDMMRAAGGTLQGGSVSCEASDRGIRYRLLRVRIDELYANER
jgi:hypothetical protein